MSIRSFIALSLPKEIDEQLIRIQNELKKHCPEKGVRWATREQLHLTLDFLGDISPKEVEKVKEHLQKACKSISSFELTLNKFGSFGRPPHILWVGVSGDLKTLARLHKKVLWSGDKHFRPHITLARLRRTVDSSELMEFFQTMSLPRLSWQISEVYLFESELLPQGARYTPLLKVPLR